jgi:tetratricopeptide (TPR) repeat protein
LAWCSEHRGPAHPNTVSLRNGLADCLSDLRRFDEALGLLEENLEYVASEDQLRSEMAMDTRCTLGEIYLELGRLSEAEEQFCILMDRVGSLDRPNDPWLAVYRLHHSRCLMALGRYQDARDELRMAHDVFTSVGSGYVVRSQQALEELHQRWGQHLDR